MDVQISVFSLKAKPGTLVAILALPNGRSIRMQDTLMMGLDRKHPAKAKKETLPDKPQHGSHMVEQETPGGVTWCVTSGPGG